MSEIIIDRFDVERELGAGALGRVVLAGDRRRDGELVAVKVLNREAIGEAGIKFLSNEFQLLRQLDHPGLAKAIDFIFDKESGQAYLAQEYVDGANFVEASSNENAEAILKWSLSIARTLTYLHSHGVVHGDLKPENVLISNRGPVLIDFGLATPAGSQAEGISGTPAYLAPELLRGAAPSPRSDLYSLGVILYQALTGKLPYSAESLSDLLIQTLTVQPAPIRELLPDLDQSIVTAIDKLLVKDPTARYQTAIGLARDMARITGEPFESKPHAPSFIPLVDREEEIEVLKKWVDRAASTGGGAVIRGGKGMGSSRLLREAADYARTKGLSVGELGAQQGAPLTESLISLVENMTGGAIDVHFEPAADDHIFDKRNQ